MSDCCSTTKECAGPASVAKPGICPDCKEKAKSVSTLTAKSLVREHWRVPASASFFFCRTAQCDVVYFSDQHKFLKGELKVRVGIKEREDPIPMCYCFGYDRSDLRRDIEARGASEIPDRIETEVHAGFCACEVKNPGGNCCLGDVNRAVKEIQAETARLGR